VARQRKDLAISISLVAVLLVRELAMLQLAIGRDLFEATGTEQAIA